MRSAVFAVALLVAVAAAGVTVLTPDNFDSLVDGSKPAFVEFYAPWCGHCKHLEPEYEEVGAAFANSPTVLVAKVDADAHQDLGSRFGVRGYPTLKWFPKGWKKGQEPEDYQGGRDAEGIIKFINDNTGLKAKKKGGASSGSASHVVDLTDRNFNEIVKDPKKHVLVEFYAPWCGHCKKLVPEYEKLANAYKTEKDIVIAKLDADKAEHKDLAAKYGVTGFPTLKFFPKDNKDAEDYASGRDIESFVTFLNTKTGTQRTASGSLNDRAGRISALDAIALNFKSGDQKAMLADANKIVAGLSGADATAGKYYVKAMEKISSEGPGFIATETARLTRLSESASTAAKLDEFKIRKNVLAAFPSA